MAKDSRVYDRYEHEGKEYLMLLKDETVKQLDASWIQTRKDLTSFKDLLHRFAGTAEDWFWIDTGVPAKLVKHEHGYVWLIDDTRENSQRFVWLSNKAKRFQKKLVERLNEMSELLSTGMDPEEAIENAKVSIDEKEAQDGGEDSEGETDRDSGE